MPSRYHQGKFTPKNPKKYLGDPTNIVYRSSWERKMMYKLDTTSSVLYWSSEELVVPYRSPKDGRIHRYFPDFIVVANDNNGKRSVTVIEVKPYKEQFPPKKQGKKKERYLQECVTYEVNQAKWAAARAYCKNNGYQFIVLTEKEILNK